MLRVVRAPARIDRVLANFKPEFTSPGYASFAQLTSALIVMDSRRTVSRMREAISDGKSRTAYEYFFNSAKWDDAALAQRKAELFFRAVNLSPGGRLLLAIDDTYEEKKGEANQGVGRFYDHARGRYIWGNNFVTSCLQAGGVYIPHIARMYLKREAAETLGYEFKTKPEIAWEEIIAPLEVPEGVSVYVVHDSWWFCSELVQKVRRKGYHVVCRLKRDKRVVLAGKAKKLHALRGEYRRVKVRVRGKHKTYLAFERVVEVAGIGRVKLVVSKGDRRRYYMSTDLSLSMEEVLEIYENRWSIELAHRESNQKFGFKDYQMRSKRAIERFMQLAFVAFAVVLIAKLTGKELREVVSELRLSDALAEAKLLYFVEMLVALQEIFQSSDSKEELALRIIALFQE